MTSSRWLIPGVFAAILLSGGAQPAAQRAAAPRVDDRAAVHVLNRLGFGPTAAALDRVRTIGIEAYIDEQLHPERVPDSAVAGRLADFTTLAKSSRELADKYFLPAQMARRDQQRRARQNAAADSPPLEPQMRTPEQMNVARMQRAPIAELTQQKILRAAYSDRQLEEVLVDFWFNHFNVFIGKGQVRTYLNEYERDAIRPHVFGRFRDLLGATAESPAMLFYLDNWQSTAAADARTSADTGPEPGEMRRQRQQMQPDRRPARDARRARQEQMQERMRQERTLADLPQMRRRGLNENYARELMELHTLGVDGGYTQKDVQEVARAFTGWTIANPRQGGPFRFDPRLHDDGEKVVLGHRIEPGGGKADGDHVLDILARHPSTARFIATKLARRFVTDNPPEKLIARAAERFRKTDGDLREVVRTIVTSPEFRARDAYRAKTKTPFEYVVSAVRATGIDVPNAMPLSQAVRDLGMPLYGAQPPTGYADRAEAWVNSGALLNRMNFALALTDGGMRGGADGRKRDNPPGARRAWPPPEQAARSLIATALAGDISESTAATVAKATTAPQALALVLGSPEFQKR